jgi:hypothetical protein
MYVLEEIMYIASDYLDVECNLGLFKQVYFFLHFVLRNFEMTNVVSH